MVKGLFPGGVKVTKPLPARPTTRDSEPRLPVLQRNPPKSGGTRASTGSVPAPKGAPAVGGGAITKSVARARETASAKDRPSAVPARTPPRPAPSPAWVPLPRSAVSRIDRAIAFLNQRARAISAEIITIGKYLLREFFADDPRAVASKDPAKMNSLRDLAARPDCPFSRATLWRAVNLALQERRLGTVSSMRQLTPTHKIALLPVQDLEEKQELAEEAVEKGWTTRELRTQVRQRSKARRQEGEKRETRGGGRCHAGR